MENEQVKDKAQQGTNLPAELPMPGPMTALPSIEEMQSRLSRQLTMMKIRDDFIRQAMEPGIDYGDPAEDGKKALLKPGAEKLLLFFGLYAHIECIKEIENFDIGLFAYTYRCEIRQIGSNIVVAVCEGDTSSQEDKYRWVWKTENELPAGVDKSTLKSRTTTYGNQSVVKYRVTAENPADKRNTLRKMAQKRALVGGTVIATATSGIFMVDIEFDAEGNRIQPTPGKKSERGSGGGASSGNYGDPISDGKRGVLYHKRKEHNISDDAFNAWLKACYGWNSDREIGWKAFKEILAAIESGKLEMPTSKPAADPTPAKETAQSASGGKISVAQTKDFYMLINSLGKTEHEFKNWLAVAYPQLTGCGVNDLMSADVDAIKVAFQKHCEGGE
ncbi:MAG: hypothetical protein WBP42_12545 [Candidatus Zixiibacteriota bacterium]